MVKKILIFVLALSLLVLPGCSKNHNDKLTELEPYIYEVEEYTKLDWDFADAFFAKRNDNYGGGCSAITKMVDGHRLVGRNMDLNISYKGAYIVRTNAGKYKTFGTAYTMRDYSPDVSEIEKNGMSDEFYKILPFMCDDVMNDAGLHVEINMRHAEFWPNGEDKFVCKGTNPESKERVFMFELPRYFCENCETIEDVKEYVKTLDIYSKNHYWNYCFIISDKLGKASLLEFSADGIYWLDEDKIDSYTWLEPYHPKAIAQTNFYLSELAFYSQDIKSGEGRYLTLQRGIDNVQNRSDMYDLIRKVQYSNYYLDYDECKNNCFDPRSEIMGEFSWATYELMKNPEMEPVIRNYVNQYTTPIRNMSREEKQEKNEYWESIFTEVVDVSEKEMFIRFYENEEQVYLIDFNGTKKINSIDDWK